VQNETKTSAPPPAKTDIDELLESVEKPKRKSRLLGEAPDLRFRLGFRKEELPFIIPFSLRAIDDFISMEDFPKGHRPTGEKGHQVFNRNDIESWWSKKTPVESPK